MYFTKRVHRLRKTSPLYVQHSRNATTHSTFPEESQQSISVTQKHKSGNVLLCCYPIVFMDTLHCKRVRHGFLQYHTFCIVFALYTIPFTANTFPKKAGKIRSKNINNIKQYCYYYFSDYMF